MSKVMTSNKFNEAKKASQFFLNAMLMTDGYKLAHKNFYAKGMTKLYSSFIPRSNRHFAEAENGVTVFGIQYFIKKILIDGFNANFFSLPKETVVESYKHLLVSFIGKEMADLIGTEHIERLHDLGYLPLEIKALKEGTMCPIGVPVMTLTTTHKDFAWIAEYLETIISNELWLPMTSATTSDLFMRELVRHAKKTGFYNPSDESNLKFLCHDFSMRGMQGIDSTIQSGMGHLASFNGTESIPAIEAIEYYYPPKNPTVVAGTVPATEHSVMCSNIMELIDEIKNGSYSSEVFEYVGGIVNMNDMDENTMMGIAEYILIKRLITEIIPNGFVSIVCDSFDFWRVMTIIIPKLHDVIMKRNGRVVVRPDSGDPVKIICGDQEASTAWERKGAYELLFDTFGGHINEYGYKVLDTHIGIIYGDSINLSRQKKIYAQLEDKGFTGENLVLGIGSYTFCLRSRDSLGFAMKANWCEVNGKGIEIYKDPKTVCGMPKKSLRGLIRVDWVDPNNPTKGIRAYDRQSKEEESVGFLKTVFKNGKLLIEYGIDEIRENLNNSRSGKLCYE